MSRPVLVVRSEPGASETAARLAEHGHAPILSPVSSIVFEAGAPDLSGVDALAFTSANGVRALERLTQDRDWDVFAVGDATALAAREAGFRRAHSASGDLSALIDLIFSELREGVKIAHVSGEAIAGDLCETLCSAGLDCRRVVVYRAEPATALSDDARAALAGGETAVLIHSALGAERFLALASAAGLDTSKARYAAISQAAGEPLAAAGLSFEAAGHPDETGLLGALARIV